jgi:hypothetical protein
MAPTFRLEVTKGPASLEGRDFAIKEDQELLLGRAAKCDLQVTQSRRFHHRL